MSIVNIIVSKVKELISKMNEQGIPIPIMRINGVPTLTGTMVVLSFTTALLGQVGKLSKLWGDIDLSQANYLLMITLGAYLGRRMQGDGKGGSLDGDKPSPKEEDQNK